MSSATCLRQSGAVGVMRRCWSRQRGAARFLCVPSEARGLPSNPHTLYHPPAMPIVVHHLDDSRSQRIIWLLEELGVEVGGAL